MRWCVLLYMTNVLLVATVRAEPALLSVSPGDTLRVLTRSRDWRDVVLDSIASGRIYLRQNADSQPLWLECESVDRVYKQGPREVTAAGVFAGFAVGTAIGTIVGFAAARIQGCDSCGMYPAPLTTFFAGVGVGTVVGTVAGFVPRHQWKRVAACGEH
jgi:hypothetical protein